MRELFLPPEGWLPFGYHAGRPYGDSMPKLVFSEPEDEGFPRWEKHADGTLCTCAIVIDIESENNES